MAKIPPIYFEFELELKIKIFEFSFSKASLIQFEYIVASKSFNSSFEEFIILFTPKFDS